MVAESMASTGFRKLRALGCSIPSRARMLQLLGPKGLKLSKSCTFSWNAISYSI